MHWMYRGILDKRVFSGLFYAMDFDWKLLLCALGLALILEGLPYFAWAEKMPAFLRYLSSRPPSMLRRLGLAAIAAGLLLLFLGRRL